MGNTKLTQCLGASSVRHQEVVSLVTALGWPSKQEHHGWRVFPLPFNRVDSSPGGVLYVSSSPPGMWAPAPIIFVKTFDQSGYNYFQTNDQNKSVFLETQLSDSSVPCRLVFSTLPNYFESSLLTATHFSLRLIFVFLSFQTGFA